MLKMDPMLVQRELSIRFCSKMKLLTLANVAMTLYQQLVNNFLISGRNFFYQENLSTLLFEDAYIATREKENRFYSDEIVRLLPKFPYNGILKREWEIRKSSLKELLSYLEQMPDHKVILELGCGNGWLSHQLATLAGRDVLGVDTNRAELQQAVRVFNDVDNLYFLHADVFRAPLPIATFDIIILASSIQYFNDINALFKVLFKLLTDNGEIHILDSPIYKTEEVMNAKARSHQYFKAIGSDLDQHYFHHSWAAFEQFKPSVLKSPNKLSLLLKNVFLSGSPFPWVRITKNK